MESYSIIPRPNKHRTYNASVKGKARRTKYRHDRSKWETDVSYLSREFVMWDGEGIDLPDGRHIYVMLAHSKGGYIADPNGLPTYRIFDFILDECAKYPDDIHVIYGGSYDFNMWLSDASRDAVERIYERDFARYGPYLLQWRRGKSFYLKRQEAARGFTIYDVVSFFQCSFIKACDSYLGDRFTHRDVIVENKAARSSFSLDNLAEVRRYNEYELENGVALMNELRARLNGANLRPRRWDGPGAVAAALLTREKVKASLTQCPDDVADAARHAYFGGRFEVVHYGAVKDASAYEYDVNSAYPHALRFVPNLQRGEWVRTENPAPATDPQEFSLWHVRYKGTDYRLPQPLPWRSSKGTVVYPGDGAFYGWYWTPDVYAAQEYVKRYGGELELRTKLAFVEENPLDRPFYFINELYKQRQVMKANGDGAHVGIKLALNSLYGKLAQQVGARFDDGEWRLPPFHQLEYAGYVTATCRSMVYRAAIEKLSDVIAYETDALFTKAPLDVPCGTNLGEWEATEFSDLTYVQSGVYFGTDADTGKPIAKTRGVNLGSLSRETVEDAMRATNAADRKATAPLTQFITAGLALRGRWHQWRRWITSDKSIEVEPQGKRVPLPGEYGTWSRTFAARVPHESHSRPFPVLWVNPDAGMVELEELRNIGPEFFNQEDGWNE